MIDQADNLTQSLQLEQPKRGRGRPATGAAMTPAEKQKAYRERQAKKGNVTANDDGQLKLVTTLLHQERINTDRLATKVIELERQLEELKKGNVTKITEKGYNVQFKAKGKRTWRSLSERGAATCEHFTEESAERSIESLKRHFPDDQYRIVKTGE